MHVPNANTVDYDATKNPVSAVTVFQADRAEVKRNIVVSLQDGQNDVEIKNLPTCLDDSSLRVDGIGNAVNFDVIYHPPSKAEGNSDATAELLKKREHLQAQLTILGHQADLLKDYSKTLTGSDTNTTALEGFLDVYATRQSSIDKQVSEVNDEIKSIDTQIRETNVRLNADVESIRKRGVRVTIIVLAEGAGDAEISLTYVVSNARWTPQYDLRAALAAGSEGDSGSNALAKSNDNGSLASVEAASKVQLHYRASIAQNTGEDWSGVSLTLSTASPLQGTSIPRLSPIWIGERRPWIDYMKSAGVNEMYEYPPPPPRGRAAPQAAMPGRGGGADASMMAYSSATVNDGIGGAPNRPPGAFKAKDSQAIEGAVSTTFEIPGLSNIPSGSDDSQQTHKVSITELDYDSVDFEWITVPKEASSAFLQCKVKNTSKYVLLPGPANVFMNNNFVAKSSISHVSPQESFSCSLGVDPALRVTYHPQSKKTRSANTSFLPVSLSGGTATTITLFEQRITLRNTRTRRIHRARVREQIPISRNARIKVNLLEPHALSSVGAGSLRRAPVSTQGVLVSDGVRVRWLPRNEGAGEADNALSKPGKADPEGLTAESSQGLLEWVCEIDAGASVDVVLAWEVSAPTGVEWFRQ